MDVAISQALLQTYRFIYQQLNILNVNILPTPDTIAKGAVTVAGTLYNACPPNIQMYYDNFVSLPVQSNIIPVFLALVVLYTIFSIILAVVRGTLRIIYNFVRFSLIVFLIMVLFYTVQQFMDQSVLDTVFQIKQQFSGTVNSAPRFVVQ
ncbi:hypothetical protein BJ944DRAFT_263871 [Cunninghamella echinulata]|nr:hypothetical protein BJ944DRAFT_263871 [Cunninghamella echinulata]